MKTPATAGNQWISTVHLDRRIEAVRAHLNQCEYEVAKEPRAGQVNLAQIPNGSGK
jgi:hypothetical protein